MVDLPSLGGKSQCADSLPSAWRSSGLRRGRPTALQCLLVAPISCDHLSEAPAMPLARPRRPQASEGGAGGAGAASPRTLPLATPTCSPQT
ncbi:hypothetical protein E2C01_096311 [Portunus trituberculatus]|uniref:Uncharacterized protein n=1 Tax=Portunus trituberculatus TaxID=210409 RepID=A0A5B7JSB2_PORTR|nr:hypothetical protein [Portunus trituberculatus]